MESPSVDGEVVTSAVERMWAHARLSRPDSGLGFQVEVLGTFKVVPSLLGSGEAERLRVSSLK